jgi:hypothetical protein
MAKVSVQIHVSTVAQNGDYRGRVINGWETYSINLKGEQVTKKRQWTIWLDTASDLAKDDVVEFTGELGTKNGKFTKDGQDIAVVEHFINSARYEVIHRAEPTAPKPVTEFTSEPPF